MPIFLVNNKKDAGRILKENLNVERGKEAEGKL
jgi:hypothetical protein